MTVAGELCAIGQLVLRGTRLIIPSTLQPRTLALAHEGHLGVVGTKQNLRTKVWWPGMDKAAGRHCRACHGCQKDTSRFDITDLLGFFQSLGNALKLLLS